MSEILKISAVCISVFFARLLQNTIGTVRDIWVLRGQRFRASLLSFLETTIWFLTFGIVLKNFLADPISLAGIGYFMSFSLGYAMGTYLGVNVEEKMAVGYVTVQVISVAKSREIGKTLKAAGYPMTMIRGRGVRGNRLIYQSVMARRHLSDFLRLVRETDPEAFITIMDTKGIIKKGKVRT